MITYLNRFPLPCISLKGAYLNIMLCFVYLIIIIIVPVKQNAKNLVKKLFHVHKKVTSETEVKAILG